MSGIPITVVSDTRASLPGVQDTVPGSYGIWTINWKLDVPSIQMFTEVLSSNVNAGFARYSNCYYDSILRLFISLSGRTISLICMT